MAKKKKSSSNIQAKKAGEKQLTIRFLERIKFIAKALIGDKNLVSSRHIF